MEDIQTNTSSTIEVEVGGRTVKVDRNRLTSWKAFKLVRIIDDGSDIEKVDAAVQFAALVSDYSEEDIVEAMGGDDASVLDVVTFAMGIIHGAYPKNLQRSQP